MAEYNIQMNRYLYSSDSYDKLYPKTKTVDVVDQNGDNLDMLLGKKIDSDEKGVANGVATLGADGKVPSSQLPQSVGDMLASTYDPNGSVATAGGIPLYVSNAINTAITSAIGGRY